MDFERIHELGAQRHPHSWLLANEKAVAAVMGRLDISKRENKEIVSEVVLRCSMR